MNTLELIEFDNRIKNAKNPEEQLKIQLEKQEFLRKLLKKENKEKKA